MWGDETHFSKLRPMTVADCHPDNDNNIGDSFRKGVARLFDSNIFLTNPWKVQP